MKIKMTSLETNEILFIVEGTTVTETVQGAIGEHTRLFGEDYLFELLTGLAEITDLYGNTHYTRTDFSDPESNFTLERIDE